MEIIDFEGKQLRIILEDKEPLFVVVDICKIIGLGNTAEAIRNIPIEWKKKILINSKNGGNIQEHSAMTFNGVRNIMYRSRKPEVVLNVEKLMKVLNKYSPNMIESISCHIKESQYIGIIKKSFERYNPVDQFSVDKYRIDLYFPLQKIAIECDEEKTHSSIKKIEDDKIRQNFIQSKLNCIFIRFNPDEKDFNIGSVISSVISAIYHKV